MKVRACMAILCAALATSAGAGAQTTYRETGSVATGGQLVWVRGTSTGMVQLFMGRGFRDASARPHEVAATTLQHWMDSVRALAPAAPDDSTAAPMPGSAAVLSPDVAMERRAGGRYAGIRLVLTGEEPIQLSEPTARALLAVLDSAARVARELSPPATSPAAVAPPAVVAAAAVLPPPTVPPTPDSVVAPPPAPAAPADREIHTPLGPFVIPGALLGDRDKEARYCYTQLGLKYNPDLVGEITVRLQLGAGGAVQDATVTKRSWQGISAGEVESCVRALAHDWRFAATDPATAAGMALLTFRFAP
jgi:hypothetical protein